MTLRIAATVSTMPPHHGGMGYVCYYNARELARRGHEVTVFTLDYGRAAGECACDGFRVVRLRTPFRHGNGGLVPHLLPLLKGFDVIHMHYPLYGADEFAFIASVLWKRRYFLTYHMDVRGDTAFKRAVVGLYDLLLTRPLLRRAGLVGAVSFDHLRSSKVAGSIDWRKVVEIPNGVDTDTFTPRGRDAGIERRLGLEGKTVVLFVGNLLRLKGLHLLIEAISRIEDEKVVLLVVGGGYQEEEYRRMVAERRLTDKVIFAGPQSPDGDLPRFYNVADFLVLPSLSESFGLVVLEAMASGKPAIVSDLPGPRRLVRDGVDGLLARPGDVDDLIRTIRLLACDRQRRWTMGKAAREKVVESHDWRRIGDRLERYLLQVAR